MKRLLLGLSIALGPLAAQSLVAEEAASTPPLTDEPFS